MKFATFFSLIVWTALPALAAPQTNPNPAPATTANRTLPKEHISSPEPTQSQMIRKPRSGDPQAPPPTEAPTPAPAPTAPAPGSAELDAYLSALNDQLALSKDEQTDIKTYYQKDGSRLQAILNDASLSPLDQQRQVDDIRAARNARILALLKDVDRQAKFTEVENSHRVELIHVAAEGGLIPASAPPNVPQPTATPPAQADKAAPGA